MIFLLGLCSTLRANHPANVLDQLGDYTPTLTFSQSVAQRVVGSGDDRETVDNYSASFRVVIGADTFAFDTTTIVRLRIGEFLLDTTLGAASDYTAGGNHATFPILDGTDKIGTAKAKWSGEKLTITGSIKSRFIPPPAQTFTIPQLEEDANYFVSETTDASLTFGALSGSRKVEVRGKSSFKAFRIGSAANPTFEDDLWKVTVVGALDFTPPKVKLLQPGKLTNATPQRYTLTTSPDVEAVTVEIDSTPATEPVVRELDPTKKTKARLWDGLLYLEAGANTVQFTAVDRSGNSSVTTFTLTHDWRSGLYSGILDTGTEEMTRTLVLNVLPGGAFTGTLLLGLEKFRFKGTFDADGLATVQLPRPGSGTPIDVQLTLTKNGDNFSDEPDPKPTILTAVFTDTFSYTIDASRAVFDTQAITPTLLAGYYTARIAPDSVGGPEGTGFLSIKANANGLIRVLGKVADGTPFSLAGPLGGDGRFLLAARLYAPADGLVQGFITFTGEEGIPSTCAGTLRWAQPFGASKSSGLFPDGFSAECAVSGGIYTPGRRIVDDGFIDDTTPLGTTTEAEISFLLGEFASAELARDFDINHKGAVRILSAAPEEKLKLSVKNKTGIFTGSIKVPSHTSPAKKFFGIIIGEEGGGEGSFISKTDSGSVTLGPR